MKFRTHSITVKVTLIYLFLAVLNISFFSVIIYENQMDLITENARFQAEKITGKLISSLQENENQGQTSLLSIKTKEESITEIVRTVQKVVSDFILFSEKGEVIYKSRPEFNVKKSDLLAGMKATAGKDFTGKSFYSHVNEKTYEIYFYVPLKSPFLKDSILLFNFKMDDISTRLANLYSLITVLIIVLALIHILFAFFLYRILIKPIQNLHGKSIEISNGNLSARVDLKRNDELGELGTAFNSMADSIQDKITELERHEDIMNMELDIATEIQQVIYPKTREEDPFTFSVFHQALEKVSGDYHDVFSLGRGRFGALILDVAGHGVPAALITMIAKEKFKLHAPQFEDPAELFKQINIEICAILEGYNAYFTAFYFMIDTNRKITFCNAGHPEALLIRSKTKDIEKIETDGPPLGMTVEFNKAYASDFAKAEKGDKIVLFTDGVTEALNANKEQFGSERLKKLIAQYSDLKPEEMSEKIIGELKVFANGKQMFRDDVTLFILEMK